MKISNIENLEQLRGVVKAFQALGRKCDKSGQYDIEVSDKCFESLARETGRWLADNDRSGWITFTVSGALRDGYFISYGARVMRIKDTELDRYNEWVREKYGLDESDRIKAFRDHHITIR